MKADPAAILRALERGEAPRLFLLYGPDEASSRDLGAKLVKPLGADAERVDLSAATLRSDPALLADEAASFSMFGGRRWIRVDPGGDELLPAIEALLAAPVAGNPVVVIGAALRKDSKLLKLALGHAQVMAHASYPPEGAAADRVAIDLGREAGLRINSELARRLVALTGGDRAVLAREIEKFALYCDAAPERPAELTHDAIEALSADADEGHRDRLVNAVLDGRPDAAMAEIERFRSEGVGGIALIRPLLAKLLTLGQLAAEVAEGNAIGAVMASSGRGIFWKERDVVATQLRRWRPATIALGIKRLIEAERAEKRAGSAGEVATEETILSLARAARRMR